MTLGNSFDLDFANNLYNFKNTFKFFYNITTYCFIIMLKIAKPKTPLKRQLII